MIASERSARAWFRSTHSHVGVLEHALRLSILKGNRTEIGELEQMLVNARQMDRDALAELRTAKQIAGLAPATRVPLTGIRLAPTRRSIPSTARATASFAVKSFDTEQREIEGWATTPQLDRVGDIVEPLGCNFTLPTTLLHQHKHDQPVGRVIAAEATSAGISIKAKIAKVTEPGMLRDRVDTAWQELKYGLVSSLSIGFHPIEYERLKAGGLHYTKVDVYELSLVSIPANPGARIEVIRGNQALARCHSVRL